MSVPNIAEIIVSLRGEKKLTQFDLAKLADMHPSWINRIEKNKVSAITLPTLGKIAKALNMSVVELLSHKPSKIKHPQD